MLRYLAAIGMSRYTGFKEIGDWTKNYLARTDDPPIPFSWPGSSLLHLEYRHEMGPFRLTLKAEVKENGDISVYASLPCARPGTITRVLDWEIGLEETNLAILGEDKEYGGPLLMRIERAGQLLNMPVPQNGDEATLAYAGLSIEGKIILGLERTEEDERAYQEDEQWRRNALETPRSGDPDAVHELEEELDAQDELLAERLQKEDIFSVLEGFFVPIDDVESGLYLTLGEILRADKAFNPETEEWVHHLELDVMGAPLDVYIHPDDLVGMPARGLRFYGKILLVGNIQQIA